MSKIENVLKFYLQCVKLTEMLRTGWKNWCVQKERVESIAEHIFNTEMLAVAMFSEFNYNVDLNRVLTMIALHETEEILIGDLTSYDEEYKTKEEKGHIAVKKIFQNLTNAKEIENLIYEFDEGKTNDAKFAYLCDKLQADIQCKLYDEEKCVDLNNIQNLNLSKEEINKYKNSTSWSGTWLNIDEKCIDFDENFKSVLTYLKHNNISNT